MEINEEVNQWLINVEVQGEVEFIMNLLEKGLQSQMETFMR